MDAVDHQRNRTALAATHSRTAQGVPGNNRPGALAGPIPVEIVIPSPPLEPVVVEYIVNDTAVTATPQQPILIVVGDTGIFYGDPLIKTVASRISRITPRDVDADIKAAGGQTVEHHIIDIVEEKKSEAAADAPHIKM